MSENPKVNVFCGAMWISRYDYEYIKIIRKMQQYGMRPTGSKSVDKRRLHEKELQEAQKETVVSSKFVTVSKSEQEKIQEKKKKKREEVDPKLYPDTTKGQKLLGEQLMLAIQMKRKEEEKLKKKKKEEKPAKKID